MLSTSYSQSLAATGGTGPYGWSVSAGALPDGLTLSNAGLLSGTPTSAGTFNFTPPVVGTPVAAEFDLPQISVTDTMVSTYSPPTWLVPGYWVPEDAPAINILTPDCERYTYHCPSGWKAISVQSEQIPGKPLWLLSITWGYQAVKTPLSAPAS